MLDAKFNLLGRSPEEGFNCLSYLYWFLKESGFAVPDSFKGYDEKNYIEKWKENPKRAKLLMLRYLLSLGEKVSAGFLYQGDIALMNHQGNIFNAIYIGRGNFLTCDERAGIIVVSKSKIKYENMKGIRPCLRQSQS